MELVVTFLVLVIGYVLFFKNKRNRDVSTGARTGSSKPRVGAKSFLPPIPKGYQIYAARFPIAGMHLRKNEVAAFVQGNNQSLELLREPDNAHDANAIKLIGVMDTIKVTLGYLPKELASQIVTTGLFDVVRPRLDRFYVGHNSFVEIQYQVIGPKVEKNKFDSYHELQPASLSQKRYFKHFGLKVPSGLTQGEANTVIKEHTVKSSDSEQDEWRAYLEIAEEFDDRDFRETYDLKKVSATELNDALVQLKKTGKSYAYLSENIDQVVDQVLISKPSLQK